MPRCDPPVHTRFPVNRPYAPHTKKHPNGYLTSKLKRFLKKKINFEDPETQKTVRGEVGDAIMWRWLLNASQGENQAIEGILDRVEGKVAQALKGEGFGGDKFIFIIKDTPKGRNNNRVQVHTAPEPANN